MYVGIVVKLPYPHVAWYCVVVMALYTLSALYILI